MGWLILITVFVLGVAYGCYWLRHPIKRWWRANVSSRNLPPHQRWPEILQWQKGDEFEGYPYHCYDLVSIDADGYAVIEFLGRREYAHLSRLVGCNSSARTRRINKRLAQSDEYMELLDAFNKSVAELEKRDEKLRLVG